MVGALIIYFQRVFVANLLTTKGGTGLADGGSQRSIQNWSCYGNQILVWLLSSQSDVHVQYKENAAAVKEQVKDLEIMKRSHRKDQ